MRYLINTFAQTYGGCNYGGTTNQTGSCASSSSTSYGGTSSSSAGSPLSNTGFDILLIVSLACLLVFMALVVRLWRRSKRQQPPVATPPLAPQTPVSRPGPSDISTAKQGPVGVGVQDDGQRDTQQQQRQ